MVTAAGTDLEMVTVDSADIPADCDAMHSGVATGLRLVTEPIVE